MKKRTLILLGALLLSVSGVFAQEITVKNRMGSNVFLQGDQYLSQKEVLELLKDNQKAYDLMKSAKSNGDISKVFAFIGGGLIGYPIGTAIGGGDPEWGLAAAGAGLVAIGIPFNSAFNRKSRQAIDMYNSGDKVGYQFQPEFQLNVKGNGLSLVMSF